uniref:Uncharacterized protein n=2 Tax=Clytia hemisphaerica TaxID=252671 RepID=A0A7M5X720_9CNID
MAEFNERSVENEEGCRKRNSVVSECSNVEAINIIENAMKSIKSEKQSYAEGLTIHGASRIATGGIKSKIIWSILVVASVILAGYISRHHWVEYLDDQSIITLKVVREKTMEYPAITICNYYGINRERRSFGSGKPAFKRPILVDDSFDLGACSFNLTKCGYNGTTLMKAYSAEGDYSNHVLQNQFIEFDNTTNCLTLSGYTQRSTAKRLYLNAVADRSVDTWSELYINPTSEGFQEASSRIYWASEGDYRVDIRKRIITRLGLPYTDCVEGQGTYTQNKFKGNYTVNKCKKGCFWEKVFEKCGAIPHMYKKHMREPHKFENKLRLNDTEAETCLKGVEEDHEVYNKCNAFCRLQPCYEEDIKMSLKYHTTKNQNNLLSLAFGYEYFLVKVYEETPREKWVDLFANFGGCVGLMNGLSILSVFELFIFFGLVLFDYFKNHSKMKDDGH